MKKLVILMLSLFLLCGCQPKKDEHISYDDYLKIKSQLELCESFNEYYNFEVSLVFNPIKNQYRYDVIIDNPATPMYNILAVAYAGEEDNAICPNIGLFDAMQYHLVPGLIDKENGYYKGINLSGIVEKEKTVKLYVSYYMESECKTKVEKYIEVSESEIR